MVDLNNKMSESFSKEILDLCNKYMILGIDKSDQCTILLHVFTGVYISLIHEVSTLRENNGEDESDDTLH
jgi:hypothetical protein